MYRESITNYTNKWIHQNLQIYDTIDCINQMGEDFDLHL